VRALAQVAFQSFEQRLDVRASTKRKVLAADLATTGGIAELGLLSGDSPGCVDPHWDVVFVDSHFEFLFA
jgi:hypothetical protein